MQMMFKKLLSKIILVAMAVCCFLAAPALCTPMDGGSGRLGQCTISAPLHNLTAEEMGNMTLGEIKEMRDQARINATSCLPAGTLRNSRQWAKNGNESLGMKVMGMRMGKIGSGPVMCGRDGNSGRFYRAPRGLRGAPPIMLLMDDLTVEDLGNMTVNQIKDLFDKNMAELNNMTLAEIEQLRDQKMQKRDNMTLTQLRKENTNLKQISGILEGLSIGRHARA